MSKIELVTISVADIDCLERLTRDRDTVRKVVWRVRIVLLSAVWRGDGANHAPDQAIQADGMALAGKVCR